MTSADTPGPAEPADPVVRALLDVDGISAAPDATLAELTTLRIGGRPRALLECATAEAVIAAVRELDAAQRPVLVLGGGSNLVVAGGDLDLVVVAVRNQDLQYSDAAGDAAAAGEHLIVRAGAGLTWDDLVADTVERGYGGLECLSGIPGSVGATPVQNVGAYGVEVAQVLRRVRVLDRVSGEDAWLEPSELGLAYRTSKLKGNDSGVVLEVEFTLRPDGLSEPIAYRELAARLGAEQGERVPAAKAREVVLELRGGKGMVLDAEDHDTWSAGSFFTNPVVPAAEFGAVRAKVAKALGDEAAEKMPAFDVMGGGSGSGVKLSAGWLIERAGFAKGYPGEAAPMRLSTKHTLALTNRGSARTKDLIALAREVRAGVEDAFGVTLHPEPVWVGCTLSGES